MTKDFLKGIIIGIASIVPGVSGGTLMVSMGIYHKLIHSISHLFSYFKTSIKFLLPIFSGIVVALLGFSFLIEPAFEIFPFETNMLFIGLITGGIPAILKQLKDKEKNKIIIRPSHITVFLSFVAVVIGTAMMSDIQEAAVVLTTDLISIIRLSAIGALIAATTIIPGVSGSMFLLLFGYYTPIVKVVNNFIKAAISFDFIVMADSILILLPLAVGLIIGVLVIAKIVDILLSKCYLHVYWAILGLVVSSPIAILITSGITSLTVWSIVLGMAFLLIGFITAIKLGD